MNKGLLYIVLFLSLSLIACREKNAPEVEVSTSPATVMPSPRASASVAVMGDTVYIFGGRDSHQHYLNDMWRYVVSTDTWTQINTFPGKARVKAAMTYCDGQIYVGMGFSGEKVYLDSCYLRDWWQYSPQTDTWKRLKDFPSANVVGCTPYHSDEGIYTFYGMSKGFSQEIYHYSSSVDRWDSIVCQNESPEPRCGGCGAKIGNRCFFGTGYDTWNNRDWYEFSLSDHEWQTRQSLPGKGRQLCVAAATDRYIYVFGGRNFGGDMTGGEVFAQYLRYDSAEDSWEHCGDMPCGKAENMVAFTLQGKVYFGLGENEDGKLIDTIYRIDE